MKDIKTLAIVLKRTNYGEADRILQLITPEGKFSALAKGVRKEKSKLAGSVEMFSVSEVVLHQGKGDLLILTGAKMKEFYGSILSDFERLELASLMLKQMVKVPEEAGEMFLILQQALSALDKKYDMDMIMAWFYLNFLRVSGEQMNFLTDAAGEKLDAETRYNWNRVEQALEASSSGGISAAEIKMMRLMWGSPLSLVLRVKGVDIGEILKIVKNQ